MQDIPIDLGSEVGTIYIYGKLMELNSFDVSLNVSMSQLFVCDRLLNDNEKLLFCFYSFSAQSVRFQLISIGIYDMFCSPFQLMKIGSDGEALG